MKPHIAFWAVCAVLMVGISAVVFSRGHYTRNYSFTVWVCFSTVSQLVALWGLMAGLPAWIHEGWKGIEQIAVFLVALTVIEACFRWESVTNPVATRCLLVMLALQFAARSVHGLPGTVQVWAHNVGFFGPAAWMFLELSGARLDALPLWVERVSGVGCRVSDAWARVMLRG